MYLIKRSRLKGPVFFVLFFTVLIVNGCASKSEPNLSVGDFYGGGIVAYILQEGDPGYVSGEQHGLIASKADISYGDVYSGNPDYEDPSYVENVEQSLFQWSTRHVEGRYKARNDYAFLLVKGTATSLGSGEANTAAILAVYSRERYRYTAAAMCVGYRGGGYSDWYLPSRDELNKMYLNKKAVGGFADDPVSGAGYWSSSEDDDISAWSQGFITGYQGYALKSWDRRVRAVRAF